MLKNTPIMSSNNLSDSPDQVRPEIEERVKVRIRVKVPLSKKLKSLCHIVRKVTKTPTICPVYCHHSVTLREGNVLQCFCGGCHLWSDPDKKIRYPLDEHIKKSYYFHRELERKVVGYNVLMANKKCVPEEIVGEILSWL